MNKVGEVDLRWAMWSLKWNSWKASNDEFTKDKHMPESFDDGLLVWQASFSMIAFVFIMFYDWYVLFL